MITNNKVSSIHVEDLYGEENVPLRSIGQKRVLTTFNTINKC